MLEYYFQSPTRLRQMRMGPMTEDLDEMAKRFRARGYSKTFARDLLSVAAEFNRFLRLVGVTDVKQVDDKCLQRFIDDRNEEQRYFDVRYETRHLREYLAEHGALAGPPEPLPSPHDSLRLSYDRYLKRVRGLQPKTCEQHGKTVREFLEWTDKRRPDARLEDIGGPDVVEYVTETWEARPGPYVHYFASYLRVFLRYLHSDGVTQIDLSRFVPTVLQHRHVKIPRYLPWEQVERLLEMPDLRIPSGMRDRAILLLIAEVGLRSREVRELQIKDIRWRRSELHLARTKTLRERVLPLPKASGEALAAWVLSGRPPSDSPFVFLRCIAPIKPLTQPGIGAIVSKHLHAAGISAPKSGPHMIRHSLATRMINAGVPVKDIADVLGHSNIDTTARYAKVDLVHLAEVVAPFPRDGAR